MRSSNFIVSIAGVCLLALAGHAFAELNSLRGAAAISGAEPPPPELGDYINDKENVERTFKDQPPVVPHTVDRYAINLKTNECLECHMKQEGKDEAKSVEMSESHFMTRDGKKLDHPAGSRHFCNQCHVPQVDAQPLIASEFQGLR